MITPNLSELPNVPLTAKSELPKLSGIYFVMDGETVLYIGKSINLNQRWGAHHRYNQIAKLYPDAHICWMQVDDPDLLTQIESALIENLSPTLNRTESVSKGFITVIKTVYINAPGIGARIRQHRKESEKTITELAAAAGISVPHWNRIENEKVGELPLETLRGIEKALDVELGVSFED